MAKHKPIRKAVFPVAGLGTRFLPATKASPKEMLPVVDKPLIQYAAEEAVEAGAELLVFVTGRNKRAIPDHFDRAYELENELATQHKDELLALAQDILPRHVTCVYVRQAQALGLGHAVLCARQVVGDDPFFVILADDLIQANPGCIEQMRAVYERTGSSVLAVQDVPREETRKYGIVETDAESRITAMVEKPKPEEARSTLAVVGRYILTPRIFDKLQHTGRGAGGEIQLTDAIDDLLGEQAVYAYRYQGRRYDCGSKLGYLQATVDYGRCHPELGPAFSAWLDRAE